LTPPPSSSHIIPKNIITSLHTIDLATSRISAIHDVWQASIFEVQRIRGSQQIDQEVERIQHPFCLLGHCRAGAQVPRGAFGEGDGEGAEPSKVDLDVYIGDVVGDINDED
jgi:hypothetical protein